MSFKDELEKILDVDEVLVYLADKNDLEPFITSIINLVDKEQLRLKANDVHVGQLMQENDEMRQAIRTLIKYGELS